MESLEAQIKQKNNELAAAEHDQQLTRERLNNQR